MKVDSIQFSMESGAVSFDFTDNEDGKRTNPVLGDDHYIEIWFDAVEELKAKTAFLKTLEHFTSTVISVNKFCKNPYDCEYSEAEKTTIRSEGNRAIKHFYRNMEGV